MIHILEKGEKADPLWGYGEEIITDEMIEALQQGKRLYITVNNEYAVVIKKDGKRITNKPERKKGRWINIRNDNVAECDQCGITGRAWMNFCFDCGADMREDSE